jgi:hypothetical chaperone protein
VSVSLHSFMPQLGKDQISMPAHRYVDAASVHNLPKQREFSQQNYRLTDEPYGSRLRALQASGATTRLNQAAECSKITLSTSPRHRAELNFIEHGLAVELDSEDFHAAIASFLGQMERTLTTVRNDLDQLPASIFLTGGTSRSPQVKARVQACFPEIPLIQGDPSLGVVSGLAVVASEADR